MEVAGVADLLRQYLRVDTMQAMSGREEAWQVAWGLILERPFSGYGFGTEDLIFAFVGASFEEHSGAMAHNSYLGLALQVGLVGALLFFLPLFQVTLNTYRRALAFRNPLLLALTASTVAALTIAVSESWIYSAGTALALPFWVIFGLLATVPSVYAETEGSQVRDIVPALTGSRLPG